MDNSKSRKLWAKCCALAGYNNENWNQEMSENISEYWESLVDLIKED